MLSISLSLDFIVSYQEFSSVVYRRQRASRHSLAMIGLFLAIVANKPTVISLSQYYAEAAFQRTNQT